MQQHPKSQRVKQVLPPKTMRLHGSVDVRQWTVSPAADLSWRRAASTQQLQAAIQDFERQIAAIQSVIRLCLCQRWCQ